MKRGLILSILVIILCFSASFATAATTISVAFGTFDSANSNTAIVSAAGNIPISLEVSGILPTDIAINELQFDLSFPSPLSVQGAPVYGPAVATWSLKQGAVLDPNTYREFSSNAFGGGPLENETLLTGLEMVVPQSFIDGAGIANVSFGNIQGAGSDTIEFMDFTVKAIPIPGSILLLGSGLIGLIGIARRKRS